ncbi:heptaprenyl diphosphate synthase component II [Aquibacillus sp. 3ASR75-11]|uniref:Heptaprenyl diphosphate synthase component 2 n=1 Tax=Terrihalobacillus insolitus TaxID=2950438 RepID=A0A9X4ANR7_9BACI|nr:heptaprenyl diphosphate synthase component II [Terrihalobacillus insolitus]MDC3413053.1 heptaprenyl diphosphate synthase component II [Terrihalobacillus insolitus]MDC3424795.1 heptaprenyl diphosphate synthase component II [Terrihalobacillus insolitus]
MKLAMMYSFLKQDIDKIEEALHETIKADHPVLREASTQLLQAGGKRIRPVFVLLAGKFGDYDLEKMKTVAVALELIHMASLVHDDVIDDAELRRGKPTVKAKWDNRTAMYTGDYIFARSLEYLSALENPRIHRILSKTILEVCLGEMEQIKDKYNWNQHLRSYLRRIKRKTALLIAVSSRLGAIAASVDTKTEKALFRYGYYVGMSYQIIDDILDFTSTEQELGKPAGGDLLQGNITLPVIYAMEEKGFRQKLDMCFQDTNNTENIDITPLIQDIKESDAIERSYQMSERYLIKAYQAIEALPNIREKQTLKNIAKYIGKRRS